jgi:hypothetical protein
MGMRGDVAHDDDVGKARTGPWADPSIHELASFLRRALDGQVFFGRVDGFGGRGTCRVARGNRLREWLSARQSRSGTQRDCVRGHERPRLQSRRTTGLTFGTVTDVATVVGPVAYAPGECWFRRSIVVEGVDGTLFSDHGDSGSAVLTSTGQLIGLLYAGNGQQTYICPIDEVLRSLNCALA